MDLDKEQAISAIRGSGWIGQIEWHREIDSSSSHLRRKLSEQTSIEEAPKRILIVADRQTAGRGRSGNQWFSPEGCLMLSIGLLPNDVPPAAQRIPLLALHVGLAVTSTVKLWFEDDAQNDVLLKWPNDVYIGRKKLAGILIESSSSNHGARWVVGIGINIAIDWRSAPQEVADRATCLSSYLKKSVDKSAVLVHLVEAIETHVNRWQNPHDDRWHQQWQECCLLNGRRVTLRTADKELSGLCTGVDKGGRLLLSVGADEYAIQSAEILAWSQ